MSLALLLVLAPKLALALLPIPPLYLYLYLYLRQNTLRAILYKAFSDLAWQRIRPLIDVAGRITAA